MSKSVEASHMYSNGEINFNLQLFAGIFPPSFQSHKCHGNVLCLVAFYEESTDHHLL